MGTRRETESLDNSINTHYEIKKRIGKGAYGFVWKGYSRKTKQPVAVKKILDAFRNKQDAQRTFREVTYLKEFKGHPNIIQLLNIHKSNNNMDLYLVFEYMDIDLCNYINCGYFLKSGQVRYILYQILKALKYIHSGNVVHRDVKPANILLNRQCVSKLADFGLARSLSDRYTPMTKSLTDYVATRWYRAPEILLGAKRYTKVIDLWSLGCVLCEMITGSPLFPGKSTIDQLERIISMVPSQGVEVENALELLGCSRVKMISVERRSLENVLSSVSEDCLDLVTKLLTFNPLRRITALQALTHPYLGKYKDNKTEPFLLRPIQPKFQDDDRHIVEDYRSAIYKLEGRISSQRILPLEIKPKPTFPLRPLMRPLGRKTEQETQNGSHLKAGPSKCFQPSSELTDRKGTINFGMQRGGYKSKHHEKIYPNFWS